MDRNRNQITIKPVFDGAYLNNFDALPRSIRLERASVSGQWLIWNVGLRFIMYLKGE